MTPEAIVAAYGKFIEAEERRLGVAPRSYVYASSWSACTRQMAFEMLKPEMKPAFSADTLANFRRGKDRERDIVADLMKVGRFADPPFEIVGGQERFELRDTKGRVAIVGKVDFRIKFAGQKGSDPAELKSWHPNLIANVRAFADLFNNRWTRRGGHQLLAYMLASNEERGWFFLDRPGIPRPLIVNLWEHVDRIEDFLKRSEIALDSVQAWNKQTAAVERVTGWGEEDLVGSEMVRDSFLPPYIEDPSECRVCPFMGSVCNPPISYEGADILTDEQILAQIEQHEALDEPRKDYKGIHDDLAEYLKPRTPKKFKGKERKQTIAGKYLLTTWWGKNTSTELPDVEERLVSTDAGTLMTQRLPFKARFQKSDEAGKFNFSIDRVDPTEESK